MGRGKPAPTLLHFIFKDHKSRARLTRSLPRPGRRWLHYLFKDHQRRCRVSEKSVSRVATVDRLTERLRDARERIANGKIPQAEFQQELKRIEGRLSQEREAERRQDMEEQQDMFKTRLAALAKEETRLQEVETQLAAQVQIEQAKLVELDDQLDALRRELEMPPAENKQPQGGKRP